MSQPDRTRSRIVTVTTNSFEITKLPNKNYTQYDVIEPEAKIPRKNQEIIHKLQTVVAPTIFSPRAVYDGRSIMYSARPLQLPDAGKGSFLVSLTSKPPVLNARGTYQVTISQTMGETIRPAEDADALIKGRGQTNQSATVMNLLQLLIRQHSNQAYPNNGKAYFPLVGLKPTGAGIDFCTGFFQAVRPTDGRILVNIDTATSAVYASGKLIDACLQVINSRNARELVVDKKSSTFRILEKFLTGLLIYVSTIGEGKRVKVINGLIPYAGRFEFQKDGRTMTVLDHYKAAYNMTLRYPEIVGVIISGKKAPFPVVVPAELCIIRPGQLYKKTIPEHLTKAMVDFATTRPDDRLKRIQHGGNIDSPITGYQHSEFIVESGMVINPSPITITGRLLEPPDLKYGVNTTKPQDGAWNVVGKKLHTPAELVCWAVINFCQERIDFKQTEGLVKMLAKCCGTLGMVLRPAATIDVGTGHAVEKSLNATLERSQGVLGPKFSKRRFILIVFLPSKAANIRLRVKHWGDITQGIHTQCLNEDKLRGAKDQYMNNVALKINARLGGYNAIAESLVMRELKREPFMIMGADVGHPGPGVKKPSTTSLVWSHDMYATQYAAFTGLQHPRVEVIAALREMVKEAVFAFGSKNRASPRRIIFFRDGVSEGEFERIAKEEIGSIKGAFDELWVQHGIKDEKPKLTFIIVGKRHHVVFFPQDASTRDKTGNCKAGFVADKGICHPIIKDFYLQSHAAVKGTSRSSHYSVLLDENFHYNLDRLQELAFSLCHVYAKATRSVSIPAPVYYADLVCSRGDFHFHPDSDISFADNSTTHSGSQPFDLARWEEGFSPVNKDFNKNMYFL